MCTSFTPVAMGGQLCYNLKLNMTGRNGRNSGLVLVLDMNEDRSLSFDFSYHPEIPKDDTVLRLDEVRQDDVSSKAKVYIRLLVPYVEFGGGDTSFETDINQRFNLNTFVMPLIIIVNKRSI